MDEFEALKIELHDMLNRLREMVQSAETLAKIFTIQQSIARLEKF